MARLGSRPAPAQPMLGESQDFWDAVRALPTSQRQAVVLFYGDDLAVTDVAVVMGCAQGTVRALLHQARQSPSAQLEEQTR